MTARTVTRAYLVCDSCGAETPLAEDALRARLQAARDGWAYGTRPNPKTDKRRRAARASSLDYCPRCAERAGGEPQ